VIFLLLIGGAIAFAIFIAFLSGQTFRAGRRHRKSHHGKP
jgi:hypothetical protein